MGFGLSLISNSVNKCLFLNDHYFSPSGPHSGTHREQLNPKWHLLFGLTIIPSKCYSLGLWKFI